MNKTVLTRYGLMAALLSVLALPGCRNEEQDFSEPSEKTVQFRAGMAETRTAFGELGDGIYPTYWTANDEGILLSLNYDKAETSAVSPSADGKTASFAATFDASSAKAPYTFYAVSPASAARAISPNRKAWSVCIAADQTPLANSVDEAAQLLVAKSSPVQRLPDEAELHFSHLTAYGRITLKNLELGTAEAFKVELVFGTPVVGEWYWHEDGTLESNGASHTIALQTSLAGDLWFACAPVDVSGVTMNVRIFTTEGILSKGITFAEGRSFASGKVARFSVDMAGVEPEMLPEGYVLVKTASQLRDGDEILIVNEAGTHALGPQNTDGKKPYRQQAGISAQDGLIADPAGATVLTLRAGSEFGEWLLDTGDGYLCSAETGNLLEVTSNPSSRMANWTVSIDEEGVATIEAQYGASRLIRYNQVSSRFTCYEEASTLTKNVMVYKKSIGAAPAEDDPLAGSEDVYGSYIKGYRRIYVKGADQYSRSYQDDGTVVFTILNLAEKEQLVISGYDPVLAKGDAMTVSVRYRKGRRVLVDRSYNLTVVRENGSKVWLGDGSGQGFIIKK